MSNDPFTGLSMSVFSSFGFLGGETTIAYALGQMEQFIQQMHLEMARETQTIFPHRGLDRESQGVFLSRALETERDLFMTFHARPLALRMALNLQERMALSRAFKAIQSDHALWYESLQELDEDWELRLQQMEFNPETNEATHYKDLFKDKVGALSLSDSAELIDRMAYLNSEEKWLAPIQLSRRLNAEFVAAMGTGVTNEMALQIDEMLPLLRLLTGGTGRSLAKRSTTKRSSRAALQPAAEPTAASDIVDNDVESFTYVADLKPLHLRKGFVNMTEAHWPFFAVNSRTVTREIILKYAGNVDKRSSVWRLVPSDKARLVVSDSVRAWMQETFMPDDRLQLTATKVGEKLIEVELQAVA